jgi:hypothetical protein
MNGVRDLTTDFQKQLVDASAENQKNKKPIARREDSSKKARKNRGSGCLCFLCVRLGVSAILYYY